MIEPSERWWEASARRFRDEAALARASFEPGDLVDMGDEWGFAQTLLLLSSPTERDDPVDAIFFVLEFPDREATVVFESSIPADFLGRYGRLLWRA